MHLKRKTLCNCSALTHIEVYGQGVAGIKTHERVYPASKHFSMFLDYVKTPKGELREHVPLRCGRGSYVLDQTEGCGYGNIWGE